VSVKAKLLLLAVNFGNHRHSIFDLSQHAQIGAAHVHWITRRTWREISRINDTLGNETLGHGYLVPNAFGLRGDFLFRRHQLTTPALPLMSEPLAK